MIEREKHAINHEFEMKWEKEIWRIEEVFRETGNPEYASSKFFCGNLETLQEAKREDVVSWYNAKYVASGMKLVFVSDLPLEELAELASFYFSKVPQKEAKLKPPIKEGTMSSDQQQGSFIHIESLLNTRLLALRWEMPKSLMSEESKEVASLIASALNHGYANSLFRALEREGLSIWNKAFFTEKDQEHGFFQVFIELTPKGVKEHEKVIEKCFQALAFLREVQMPRNIFEELKTLEKGFVLGGYNEATKMAEELVSGSIEEYPREKGGAFGKSMLLLPSLLEALSPKDCIYFFMAPAKETKVKFSHVEEKTKAKYKVKKISKKKISEWTHPYLGVTLWEGERSLSQGEKIVFKHLDPILIVDDERGLVLLKEELTVKDKIEAFFRISTPVAESSLQGAAALEIFSSCYEKKCGKSSWRCEEWRMGG